MVSNGGICRAEQNDSVLPVSQKGFSARVGYNRPVHVECKKRVEGLGPKPFLVVWGFFFGNNIFQSLPSGLEAMPDVPCKRNII